MDDFNESTPSSTFADTRYFYGCGRSLGNMELLELQRKFEEEDIEEDLEEMT